MKLQEVEIKIVFKHSCPSGVMFNVNCRFLYDVIKVVTFLVCALIMTYMAYFMICIYDQQCHLASFFVSLCGDEQLSNEFVGLSVCQTSLQICEVLVCDVLYLHTNSNRCVYPYIRTINCVFGQLLRGFYYLCICGFM